MAEELIKRALFELFMKTVVVQAITVFPFLSWPFFNPLFLYLVRKVSDKVYDQAKKEGIEIYIQLKTEKEKRQYAEAVNILRNAAGKSEEEINAAREEFDRRLRDLIRLRPVRL